MDIEEFEALFRVEVRAALNWSLLEERCGVELEIIVTRAELGLLETVWYTLPDGSLSHWHNQQARRLLVSEAANITSIPSASGAEFINKIRAEFVAGLHPRVWGIPLYKTKTGRHIILDGNHRLIALLRSGAPIRIIAAVIHGHDSEDLLPDLLHDRCKNESPATWREIVTEIQTRL